MARTVSTGQTSAQIGISRSAVFNRGRPILKISELSSLAIYVIGGGIGVRVSGRLFGCHLSLPMAFVIAGIGTLAYRVPTVGAAARFLVIVVLIRHFSGGDLTKALLTTSIANGVLLCLALVSKFEPSDSSFLRGNA